MLFEFLFILIGKSTMAFLTGQSWRVLKSWCTGGSLEQGFWRCFADGRNQSLVSSVARLANCCLRSSFWFTCMPVPCDCFCGAGYWSTPHSPPPSPPLPEMSTCPPRRISLPELARVIIWLFQLLLVFTLPRESRITIFAATLRENFEGVWEVNKRAERRMRMHVYVCVLIQLVYLSLCVCLFTILGRLGERDRKARGTMGRGNKNDLIKAFRNCVKQQWNLHRSTHHV